MDLKIFPSKLQGSISAIPSKSQAHRLLICAAFSSSPTELVCPDTNEDIDATVFCLNAIGAHIVRSESGFWVEPINAVPQKASLDCKESGSTLRFMLPIICALGIEATISMSGRLPYRPLSPLWEELERMGCKLERPSENTIRTTGKLRSGEYIIAGNISSQFVTGLLFALTLLDGTSHITITGNLESKPYVDMTQKALKIFGVDTTNFVIPSSYPFSSPGKVIVEGDWSNAAFFLVAAALGNDITVSNLQEDSSQGDHLIAEILTYTDSIPKISAKNIPDLVPILAVYFAAKAGAIFQDIQRLRLKESDRVASVISLLMALGIPAKSDESTLCISGGSFTGGIIDSYGDHRIAMAAAVAATRASAPVTILGAECVSKSYPAFWQEYQRLGGNYEQYIR